MDSCEQTEQTLLSNLYKVGKNFSVLIYSHLDSLGFDEFSNICRTVLTTLQRQPKLTDYLVCSHIVI